MCYVHNQWYDFRGPPCICQQQCRVKWLLRHSVYFPSYSPEWRRRFKYVFMYTLKCPLLLSAATKTGMCTQILIADTKTNFIKIRSAILYVSHATRRTDKRRWRLRRSFPHFSSETRPYPPHFVAHKFSQIRQFIQIWCDFDRASSLICGNTSKMPTRCNRGFYCRSYCLLNMFRAPLCSSSGAQEYYTVVAACGISCYGFQVAGLVWS